MRCLLIGNFGVSNLGDEALKEYFLSRYQGVDWVSLSASPKGPTEVSRLPAGIRSFFSCTWLRTLKEYKACDAIVYGGGSLFTDAESAFAPLLWWLHSLPARVLGKPIHLAFQGIGPCKTRIGQWCTTSICRAATTISVRDSLSYVRVEKMGLNKKCIQTCDPIYSLFKAKKLNNSSKNILTIIPRNNSSEKLVTAARLAFRSSTWDGVVIISMKPDDKSENAYCQMLIDTEFKNAALVKVRSLDEILHNIAKSSLVVSERYHGALAAMALGKKVQIVPQYKGDKLFSLEADKQQDWNKLLEDGEQWLNDQICGTI